MLQAILLITMLLLLMGATESRLEGGRRLEHGNLSRDLDRIKGSQKRKKTTKRKSGSPKGADSDESTERNVNTEDICLPELLLEQENLVSIPDEDYLVEEELLECLYSQCEVGDGRMLQKKKAAPKKKKATKKKAMMLVRYADPISPGDDNCPDELDLTLDDPNETVCHYCLTEEE